MKILLIAILHFFSFLNYDIQAQSNANPVNLKTEVKDLGNNEYNLIVTVLIDKSWHIYSQNIKSGGPVATNFKFNNNPLIKYIGKPTEVGQLEKKFDPNFKIDLLMYANQVQFIQKIKLKAKVKTIVEGAMEYMVCTDEKCLPPTTKKIVFNL